MHMSLGTVPDLGYAKWSSIFYYRSIAELTFVVKRGYGAEF